ncbi:hypothetical protein M427DRAFT_51258 [Gonapodya prolifera JEL478]|uniref:Uncharacterized protein n=1 Tax=Gonapodya prolifera (strain JEL478) TaxID=1344416 RepID=A0A139AYR8_GONPJ|nr:hypothetical protein M427DRAFT_51258 [Gonapodya prolifera JEL478]|eukprot:KXS21898.1 hypothetical protein M427DRAFT_51258 [Gonapodya prolifera JEL478]
MDSENVNKIRGILLLPQHLRDESSEQFAQALGLNPSAVYQQAATDLVHHLCSVFDGLYENNPDWPSLLFLASSVCVDLIDVPRIAPLIDRVTLFGLLRGHGRVQSEFLNVKLIDALKERHDLYFDLGAETKLALCRHDDVFLFREFLHWVTQIISVHESDHIQRLDSPGTSDVAGAIDVDTSGLSEGILQAQVSISFPPISAHPILSQLTDPELRKCVQFLEENLMSLWPDKRLEAIVNYMERGS